MPVSVGCKPSSVPAAAGRRRRAKAIYLDPPLLTGSAPKGKQPTRGHEAWTCQRPLLGLAPGGVCHAGDVTAAAVRSYRTFSPLPVFAFGFVAASPAEFLRRACSPRP